MNPQAPNPQIPSIPNSGGPYPEFSQQALPQQPYHPYASAPVTIPGALPPTPGQLPFNSPNYAPLPQPPLPASNQPVVPGVQPVGPPKAHANPNSTQNALEVAEVRDGIVIMNDGSFRSVVMVKSINFDLMSQQEQEAVEYSYQGFLNSLYFPVQIFIRSQKVDLEPYIEKLDRIRTEHDNMLLAMLMEDYITFIDNLSQQTNIMDKKFYVIIPFFPQIDMQKAVTSGKSFLSGLAGMFNNKEHHVVVNETDLEKGKTELRNRVQAVLSGLQQSGIQGLPLDTQELIELYYDTYNPDTATRQQLKNFDNLAADIIVKGQGVASQSHLQGELR